MRFLLTLTFCFCILVYVMTTKDKQKRRRCTIYLDDDAELLKAIKIWMRTSPVNNLSSAFKYFAKEQLGIKPELETYIRSIVRDELQKAQMQGVEL